MLARPCRVVFAVLEDAEADVRVEVALFELKRLPEVLARLAGATGALGVPLVRALLESYAWSVPYAQLDRDAGAVAAIIGEHLADGDALGPVTVEMLRAVFYRNKGAYLVGRVRRGELVLPLVLPLISTERGIVVDAVLMTENEASIVFGFSWSYFRVEAPHPRAMIEFLRTIMPLKRVDELYTAIGFNKHGKTELYRSLMAELERPEARFAFAEGDEGMVMAVFTLPSSSVVFKIIKDTFGAPKNTTRQAVMEKYHFVFVRPAFWLGRQLWKRGDEGIIDRFGPDGAAWAVQRGAVVAKRVQSGYLTSYALIMLLGLVAAITWVLF